MCVTFNMKGMLFGKKSNAMEELDDLFQKDDVYHDIYAFATQEAEKSIIDSLLDDKKDRLLTQI